MSAPLERSSPDSLKRELDARAIRRSFLGAAETSAMIFMIFLGADMLNSALALSQMPAQLAQVVGSLNVPPLLIVGGVLLLYVALGCVMDELSMILLTIPVVFPAIMSLDLFGLNPSEKAIWFGILVLMVVEIGLIAPPVGLNVYVINGLARDVPDVGDVPRCRPFSRDRLHPRPVAAVLPDRVAVGRSPPRLSVTLC